MNTELTKKSGIVLETKENLTYLRRRESTINFMNRNPAYTEIEKTFGKYLFVPYDVPKIELKDIEFFKSWFFANAKYSTKLVEDMSSGLVPYANKAYMTVDSTSPQWDNSVWSRNPIAEIYTLFPEIFEQIHEYMPWVGPDNFRWNIWSSHRNIIPHRDLTSCVDLPFSMRIKLYDGNPDETLQLMTDPIKEHSNEYQPIPKLTDTNTFGWNNLRTKHRSVFHGDDFRKILFIWRDPIVTETQLTQLADLLERSINKYTKFENQVLIDTNDVTDYINL